MGIATGVLGGALIGAVVAAVAPIAMAVAARNSGRPFDERALTSDDDVFAQVEDWARAHGYRSVRADATHRVYRSGGGVLASPTFLEVARDGQRYAFRSYLEINGWLLKATLALSGGGALAKVPRALAKRAHNVLFARLGLPALD